MYHPDCKYAIRTIPSLVHSKTDPEDVDTEGEDHAADADRYGFMARPSPTKIKVPKAATLPGSVKDMIDSMRVNTERGFGKVS